MYCRAVALANGHQSEDIDSMSVKDLELLAVYDSSRTVTPMGAER